MEQLDADRSPDDPPAEPLDEAPTAPATTAPDDGRPGSVPVGQPGGAVVAAAVAGFVGLGLGAAVGHTAGRRRRSKPDVMPHDGAGGGGTPAPEPVETSATAVAVSDEGGLILGLIESYDLASSESQRVHIVSVLQTVGVERLAPQPGQQFDPSRHRALTSEATTNGATKGHIARVERPGWRRGPQLLRYPEVVVFR
jgi:hypothetical protein